MKYHFTYQIDKDTGGKSINESYGNGNSTLTASMNANC